MPFPFLRPLALLSVILTSRLSAAVLNDGLQKGKEYYFAGDIQKAIVQFQRTIQAHPNDPEPHCWLGKSYAVLSDLNAPILGARARRRARQHLAKAVQLAPDSAEYRHELFHFLVGSDDAWSAGRAAEALLGRRPAAGGRTWNCGGSCSRSNRNVSRPKP